MAILSGINPLFGMAEDAYNLYRKFVPKSFTPQPSVPVAGGGGGTRGELSPTIAPVSPKTPPAGVVQPKKAQVAVPPTSNPPTIEKPVTATDLIDPTTGLSRQSVTPPTITPIPIISPTITPPITPTETPVEPPPTYKVPTTDNSALMSKWGITPEQIQSNLETEKASIRAKYDLVRKEAQTKTENEKQAQLSNLYKVGVVNPASSGLTSIGSASQDVLNQRLDAINAQESAEITDAVNRAYGREETGFEKERQAGLDVEEQAQKQYENARQAWADKISATQTGRQWSQEDKNTAQKDFANLISLGGSASFDGATIEDYKANDKASGWKEGTTQKILEKIKAKEQAGGGSIQKDDTGGIYWVKTDQYGNYIGTDTIKAPTPKDSLTPSQINSTVNSIASAFDNEPIVKSYNVANEGYQTISSIGVNTTSPADDIAFIYAFAKIMDPNSVVREGEYNTIQKYAQTWADNFGFTAKRIFSNTNFLSADAKQKMLNALKPKIDTLTDQYNNLHSEYQRQIDDAYAGKPRIITQYGQAFNEQNAKSVYSGTTSSGIGYTITEE